MKKIGFIDYYLNEWHALNYPEMIASIQNEFDGEFRITHAYAEIDHPNMSTDEYCKKYNVIRCSSIDEICHECDYLILLYPDDPERKCEVIKKVISFGKPVFVDKTFVNSYEEAKEVFECAKKYNTPMFTSSSLRYSIELKELPNDLTSLFIVAPSVHLKDYWVHPLEMLVSKMGVGAKKVKHLVSGNHHILQIKYENKDALIVMAEMGYAQDFFVSGNGQNGQNLKRCTSPYFVNEMRDVLRFFKEKTPSFDYQQTLEIMRIRDLTLLEKYDEWLEL